MGANLLAVVLAVPGSLWVTVRASRALVSGILAEGRPRVPAYLEAVLPLKGRWLRYLIICLWTFPMIAALFISQLVVWWLPALVILKSLGLAG